MTPLRILLCEDETLTVLRMRKTLRLLGHEPVGEAGSGEEAVRLARELRPDVILMDVNMPGMDGIEAARRIMLEAPTAIVTITAYSEPEHVARALEAGASGYLVKPLRDEQLLPVITVALARFRRHQQSLQLQAQNRALTEAGRTDRALLQEAERVAHEARKQAHQLTHRLERERDAARILAEGFVSRPPVLPGVEIASRYEPATEPGLIGGDFLDFVLLRDERLGIVVGDLCGHGLDAAPHLARAKYMLRAYMLEDSSPALVAARLNRALHQRMQDDCPFLTMVYGVLDLRRWSFTYCSAGHPPPLLRDPEAGCRELPSTGGLIGVIPDMEYEERAIPLAEGATLALFTDGVLEARRGRDMFGHEGIGDVLCREAASAADVADRILQAATEYAGNRLTDDVALVVIRRCEGRRTK